MGGGNWNGKNFGEYGDGKKQNAGHTEQWIPTRTIHVSS